MITQIIIENLTIISNNILKWSENFKNNAMKQPYICKTIS